MSEVSEEEHTLRLESPLKSESCNLHIGLIPSRNHMIAYPKTINHLTSAKLKLLSQHKGRPSQINSRPSIGMLDGPLSLTQSANNLLHHRRGTMALRPKVKKGNQW